MGISQKRFKIALLGMDPRSRKIVDMSLSQESADICDVVDLSVANVALLDLDGANHEADLQCIRRQHAQMPIIAISIKANEAKGMYFLRKPLSIPNFIDLLTQIYSAQQVKRAAGDGIATSKTANPKQKTAVIADILDRRGQRNVGKSASYAAADADFFDPNQFTLSYVQEAVSKSEKTQKQIVVQLWNDQTILVDAQHRKILTDVSISKMRAFGVAVIDNKLTKVKIKVADPTLKFDFSPRFNNALRVASVDEFIWQLAIITARGRIPKFLSGSVALDLQKPVYIKEWPNFTRLDAIPHAIPTVAYWIRQPTPLGKLASLLSVDEKHINGLFFACHSIGIAGQARQKSDRIFESAPATKHKHRSLFGAIIDHLKGK